jgi:predicted alpha/beta hydrolase
MSLGLQISAVPSASVEARELTVPARDGYGLAATLFEPSAARGAVVVGSATGVPRRFYGPFARHLASHGLATVTFDYRGIGGSRPRSLRSLDAGMADWGALDLAGVVDWVAHSHLGRLPTLYVGHSVGGQVLPLADNAGAFRAAYLVASQSGYWGHWDGRRRLFIACMWHVAVPAVASVCGRLPAALLGGGEDLPPGVAREWARWGRHPEYVVGRVPGAAARFASLAAPVRMVSFTDDHTAPRRAVDALASFYTGAKMERWEVRPADVGARQIGHFGFFREPVGRPLWDDAVRFLERHV